MTAVIDNATHYADHTNSWAQPNFDNHPMFGSGGLTTATGTGSHVVYDIDTAKRMALNLYRAHTGVDLAINGPVLWVYGNTIHSVERSNHQFQADASALGVNAQIEYLSVADTMLAIRASFGLTVTQLAEVMKVERVTIYAWMSSNARDSMRDVSRNRLRLLHKIATTWASKSPLYGKYLHEGFTANGDTVYGLLTEENLDPVAFDRAHQALRTIRSSEKRKLGQMKDQRTKNKAIGLAFHAAFKKLGS